MTLVKDGFCDHKCRHLIGSHLYSTPALLLSGNGPIGQNSLKMWVSSHILGCAEDWEETVGWCKLSLGPCSDCMTTWLFLIPAVKLKLFKEGSQGWGLESCKRDFQAVALGASQCHRGPHACCPSVTSFCSSVVSDHFSRWLFYHHDSLTGIWS